MKIAMILSMILSLFFACENPFGKDEITGENRTLTGAIHIDHSDRLDGVYAWLDIVNVGAFTDDNGQFTLTLPPKSAMNVSGEVSGEFDLYIYSINLELKVKKVILRNGVIVYGEGDVDKHGAVPGLDLRQTFSVETRTAFPRLSPGDAPRMSITAHMQAKPDSFAVNIPGGNLVLLGGVFIKNIETGEVHIFELAGTEGRPYIDMLHHQETLWSFHPDVFGRGLQRGSYKVYPLVYPYYPNLPPALFESLEISSRIMDAKYLKLLCVGSFAEFKVLENLQP